MQLNLAREVIQKKCSNIAEGIVELIEEKKITTVCLGKPPSQSFPDNFTYQCF